MSPSKYDFLFFLTLMSTISPGTPFFVKIIFSPSFLEIDLPSEPASVSLIFSKTIFLFFLPNSN